MSIRRISFLGVRTSNFEAMTVFVRDVLGLRTSHLDDDWGIFPLKSGGRDYFEIYGPGHTDQRLMTAASDGPIAAFAVDDLVAARAELEVARTEMLSDVIWAAEAFGNLGGRRRSRVARRGSRVAGGARVGEGVSCHIDTRGR